MIASSPDFIRTCLATYDTSVKRPTACGRRRHKRDLEGLPPTRPTDLPWTPLPVDQAAQKNRSLIQAPALRSGLLCSLLARSSCLLLEHTENMYALFCISYTTQTANTLLSFDDREENRETREEIALWTYGVRVRASWRGHLCCCTVFVEIFMVTSRMIHVWQRLHGTSVVVQQVYLLRTSFGHYSAPGLSHTTKMRRQLCGSHICTVKGRYRGTGVDTIALRVG